MIPAQENAPFVRHHPTTKKANPVRQLQTPKKSNQMLRKPAPQEYADGAPTGQWPKWRTRQVMAITTVWPGVTILDGFDALLSPSPSSPEIITASLFPTSSRVDVDEGADEVKSMVTEKSER